MESTMKLITKLASLLAVTSWSFAASAAPLSVFSGWNMLANDDGTYTNDNAFVDPGYGGQKFDAEYLFYKLEGNTLSVGLQTGFDIISDNGYLHTDGRRYYTGDLALSFDGNSSNYEYAVDFGNATRGYKTGAKISTGDATQDTDVAGLYSVSAWNNDVYFGSSAPYGMDGGSLLVAANGSNFQEGTGPGNLSGQLSYYNIFTFDLSNIAGLAQTFGFAAHWTMSCGNDEVEGSTQVTRVAEPGSLILLGLGLIGLVVTRRRIKAA